jgi:hypothetical protein
MGTYVLHEHTFPCQVGKYPFKGEAVLAQNAANLREAAVIFADGPLWIAWGLIALLLALMFIAVFAIRLILKDLAARKDRDRPTLKGVGPRDPSDDGSLL